MYVCVCHAVSDRTVSEILKHESCSFAELRKRLGFSSSCGRCSPCLRDLIAEHDGTKVSCRTAGLGKLRG
ncbi:MAG: (2Fe-2S)-binding protein [Gammaproteobacteria bacterium]|nr:(2Fe-2S)-binding protein [Gammaproteobacteria bacterium]